MNLNEYQVKAKGTAVFAPEVALTYLTLGLAGEAGEVAEKVKKTIRGDRELDKEGLLKELGDVLWYVAVLTDHIGYTLDDTAKVNLDKLASRQQRGALKGSGDER